ncbi:unnamed protein product, partial [Meganyctiphanes norvegica]
QSAYKFAVSAVLVEMKVLIAVVGVLALAVVQQVQAQGDIREQFGAACGTLSRRDCIKRIRACRRVNTAMTNEISSASDILKCTQKMDVPLDQIIDAFNKFNNGEGDAPTLDSFGVNEGIMKELRNCILGARGLLDTAGNVDKEAVKASTEATLNRILGPDQPNLLDAIINAKETCGKPTVDTMKDHRDCMNQICLDNINA